jgi:hypothetical protein
MIFNVEMLAFGKGKIRSVNVPDAELSLPFSEHKRDDILELVYKYGQNDFQPMPFPSVSVGDVINYQNSRYEVDMIGFKKLM